MERTLGACVDCEEIVVVGLLDEEIIPLGQSRCANCGGTEFVAQDAGRTDAADDD